jgi:hypothetical protein
MVPEYDFKRDKDIDIKVYPEVDQGTKYKEGDKLAWVKPPVYDAPKYSQQTKPDILF